MSERSATTVIAGLVAPFPRLRVGSRQEGRPLHRRSEVSGESNPLARLRSSDQVGAETQPGTKRYGALVGSGPCNRRASHTWEPTLFRLVVRCYRACRPPGGADRRSGTSPGGQKWRPTCSAVLGRCTTQSDFSRRSMAPVRLSPAVTDTLEFPDTEEVTPSIQYGPRHFSKILSSA